MKHTIFSILAVCGLLAPTLANAQTSDPNDPLYAYVPKGYVIKEVTEVGDLNKDGLKDKVLIVKNTLESAIDKDTGKDLNRRGMIILFATNGNGYRKAAENLDCFNSEEEDGGAYLAPDLMVDNLSPTNLIFGFSHGRYGNWQFTFRYQQGGFKLIGYDENVCRGPFTMKSISINFLTGKKKIQTNTRKIEEIMALSDADPDGYKDQFTERTTKIARKPLIDFTAIKDYNSVEDPENILP
ncbi:MAG: hypothetical protein HUK08_06875 [Bacteroidaceae bacterium]|nr:hypothetical protein [Bacteroidaceae bacterium]